ncbi:MAG: restriction endonuclease subunit S [Actinomyces sp.]|nr:restriction endonuclease subunit S [Actinomyces sp.]
MSRQFRGERLPDWVLEPNYEHDIIPVGYVFQKSKVVPGPSESEQYQRLSLTMNGVLPRSREATDGLQPENFDGYQLIKPGQLIFKLIDLQNVSTSRVGLSEDLGLVSPAYIALTADRRVLPKYAYWYFMDLYNRRIFNNLSEGGVRANLSWEGLRQLPFILPSIERQRRIVEFLDAELEQIDALVAVQERLTALLSERRVALADVIMESIEADLVKLRFLFAPRNERANGDEEVLSVYRDYGIIPKNSRSDNHNVTPEDLSNYRRVTVGDLVVNKMKAWQGSVAISDFEGIVSGDYQVLRPITIRFSSQFAHHILRSSRMIREYRIRSKGIRPSQWRLYWEDLADIRVPVPNLAVQESIERRFVDIAEQDPVGESLESLRQLLEERRAALITAAVTGELEV